MMPIDLAICGLLLISVFKNSPSPSDSASAWPSMSQSISRAIAAMATMGADDEKPHRQAAQEQRQPRAFEPALQIAIAGVAHLEALDEGLRPRISEPERDDDDGPAHQRVERIAPRRAVLVEAQAAEHRARQPIAPRPIERIFAEQRQQRKADQRRLERHHVQFQRHERKNHVERDQDGDGEQKADQTARWRARYIPACRPRSRCSTTESGARRWRAKNDKCRASPPPARRL